MDVTTPEDSEDVNVLPYASSEADNMRFIAANTNIPILRVYEDTSASIKSITMEYIPGESLDKVWGTLLEEQKLALAAELKQVLSELRGLKGRYIGALNRGQAMDVRKFDLVDGPFDTEAAFNDFLLSDTFKAIPTVMHDMASRSLRTDHEIVFTHGDFAPRNIIVKDGKLAAIIDSEFSGWYP
ncbi:Protein kinase-like (PK-like) [Glarea lozoyensis ATCC 20868]|uniref:Protein kinase-like (PK-like) n=1 Tax=Glarea lozoyensis (strain ATCC 20868 / MF5171) TaxID=1116229 RepID=S3DDF5_GLAL2|nr:Protein kinase-like (PK-like) [Glarea lozoyensis ATCC 20868]EPE30021.1 Protein kinase-like (PK-like) [Glarea lozoyensis ATCC 20868]